MKSVEEEQEEMQMRENERKVVQIRGPQSQSTPNTDEPRKARKSQEQKGKKSNETF